MKTSSFPTSPSLCVRVFRQRRYPPRNAETGEKTERTNCLQLISPCFDTRHEFMFLAARKKVSETNHFVRRRRRSASKLLNHPPNEIIQRKKVFFSLYISWPAKTKFIVDWLLIYGESFFFLLCCLLCTLACPGNKTFSRNWIPNETNAFNRVEN